MSDLDSDAVIDVVARFSSRSLQHPSLTDVLYDASSCIVELLGGAGAGVSLAPPEGGTLQFVSASSELVTRLEHIQSDTREGPCLDAYHTGEATAVADIADEDRWPAYSAEVLAADVHGVLGVPMHIGARCVGSINVYDHQPRKWLDGEVRVVQLLADVATSHLLPHHRAATGPAPRRAAAERTRRAGRHRVGQRHPRRRTAHPPQRGLGAAPPPRPQPPGVAALDRPRRRGPRPATRLPISTVLTTTAQPKEPTDRLTARRPKASALPTSTR